MNFTIVRKLDKSFKLKLRIKKKLFNYFLYQGLHSGSLSGLRACVAGLLWKAWKSLAVLLKIGISWGLETIVTGAFWLGTRIAAIFPLASCPGIIWNWAVFSRWGLASSVYLVRLGVGKAKLVDPRVEAIGTAAIGCGCCICCCSFSVADCIGFIAGVVQGVQYVARCDSKRARTCGSSPSSDIR